MEGCSSCWVAGLASSAWPGLSFHHQHPELGRPGDGLCSWDYFSVIARG